MWQVGRKRQTAVSAWIMQRQGGRPSHHRDYINYRRLEKHHGEGRVPTTGTMRQAVGCTGGVRASGDYTLAWRSPGTEEPPSRQWGYMRQQSLIRGQEKERRPPAAVVVRPAAVPPPVGQEGWLNIPAWTNRGAEGPAPAPIGLCFEYTATTVNRGTAGRWSGGHYSLDAPSDAFATVWGPGGG